MVMDVLARGLVDEDEDAEAEAAQTPILPWLPFSKSSLWCHSWCYSLMPSSVVRPDTPRLSFLPGDITYESPGGNVRVYFPTVTSIVLSVVLTLILRLFGR